MLRILSTLVALSFLVLGILLGLLNPSLVSFDYYFNQIQLPLSILLGMAFFLGMMLSIFFMVFQLLSLGLQIRKLNKKSQKHVNEIIELKKQLSQARFNATMPSKLLEQD